MSELDKVKEIMRQSGIRAKKELGQNFLVDDEIISDIVEALDVSKRDIVIEIGPGIGSLTESLCRKAGMVAAVEIDRSVIPALKKRTSEFNNLKIINGDILKTDLKELFNALCAESDMGVNSKTFKVAGNLPYYITTPIIMGLLEKRLNISDMVFMVQKEVAQRITSLPGIKDYGVLSVMVQYYAVPSIEVIVPADKFLPQPEVDSAVIKLEIRKEPAVKVKSEKLYFDVVKAAFNQRRKTLLNALSNSPRIGLEKKDIRNILADMGIDENTRGEELSLQQFAALCDRIYILLES